MRFIFVSMAFAALGVQSVSADKSNLSQLSADAVKSNSRVLAKVADRDATKARKSMSLSMFRPQLSLNGYGTTGNGTMIFPNSIEPANYNMLPSGGTALANATFMWKAFSFGRDRDTQAAGSSEVLASEAAIQVESLDVLYDLRRSFAEATLAQETLVAKQAALDSSREVERVTKARLDAGKVPEAFLFRAKSETAKSERELAIARSQVEGSISEIRLAAGRDQTTPFELGEWDIKLDAPVDLTAAMAEAAANRPELKMLKFEVAAAEFRISANAKLKLPELSVMAMSDWMGSREMMATNSFSAGLVLSFPLTDGGKRRSESAEAVADLAKLNAEAQSLKNEISSQFAKAWAAWQSVRAVRLASEAELSAGLEGYRVAVIRFEEGKSILAELIDARAQLVLGQLAVSEARAYERNSWAKLARAIGK